MLWGCLSGRQTSLYVAVTTFVRWNNLSLAASRVGFWRMSSPMSQLDARFAARTWSNVEREKEKRQLFYLDPVIPFPRIRRRWRHRYRRFVRRPWQNKYLENKRPVLTYFRSPTPRSFQTKLYLNVQHPSSVFRVGSSPPPGCLFSVSGSLHHRPHRSLAGSGQPSGFARKAGSAPTWLRASGWSFLRVEPSVTHRYLPSEF
jgi:hypothetical protein